MKADLVTGPEEFYNINGGDMIGLAPKVMVKEEANGGRVMIRIEWHGLTSDEFVPYTGHMP